MAIKRYVATSNGYLGPGLGFIKEGTEFDYAGKPGKWMRELSAPKAPAAPKEPKAPAAPVNP